MKRSPMPQRRNGLARTAIARVSAAMPLGAYGRGRSRAAWRTYLDDLARAVVMIRAGAARIATNEEGTRWGWYGRCERCMCERWLYWSHIEPKGTHPAIRWDTLNAFAFCYHCHMQWWHKHPREAEAFTVSKLGAAVRAALAMRADCCGRRQPDYGLAELDLKRQLVTIAPGGVLGIEL